MCLQAAKKVFARSRTIFPFGFALDPAGNFIRFSSLDKESPFGWKMVPNLDDANKIQTYPLHHLAAKRCLASQKRHGLNFRFNFQDDQTMRTGYRFAYSILCMCVAVLVIFSIVDISRTKWGRALFWRFIAIWLPGVEVPEPEPIIGHPPRILSSPQYEPQIPTKAT
eukprot:PhF_6_TR18601/c0_g1_i3/m.27179